MHVMEFYHEQLELLLWKHISYNTMVYLNIICVYTSSPP